MGDTKELIKQVEENTSEEHLLKCIDSVKANEPWEADEECAKCLINKVTGEDNSGVTKHVLKLIADIARAEGNRPLFKDEALTHKLITHLTSDSPEVMLCLYNLVYLGSISTSDSGFQLNYPLSILFRYLEDL